MNKIVRIALLLSILVLGILLNIKFQGRTADAQELSESAWVTGLVIDEQDQPVDGTEVKLLAGSDNTVLAETITQDDGHYSLGLTNPIPGRSEIQFDRAHFKNTHITLERSDIDKLRSGETVTLPEITLQRRISPAFWIATLVFAVVLVLIAASVLHNTLAALVGAALIFLVSYLGGAISENLYIFNFDIAMNYIDWNVIFLVMGMMVVIAVIEKTGIFQWMSYIAYRVSGGRIWLLLLILMLITGIASAFLDNVTTMLLMTPISVQISLSLGINPLALLIPEVMASNVVGVSTLVGTPTNVLIGSYAGISFNDFLVNLTPGVLMAFAGLVIYSLLIFRGEFAKAKNESPMLMKRLAERGQITKPGELKKAGWVGAGMLILFIAGERIHLLPSVTALIGATALMVWIKPNIEEMIEAVDWTTLVFFMSLFIVVGAIQEVGLISLIAQVIGDLVGNSLILTMLTVVWLSAILSMLVANIPFTAAMLPVVGFLSASVPGANSKVLFYCLSVGSAMGGNGSLIGSSANMVTAGIADGAGYPISYAYFLKKGVPALLITVGLATIWLLFHYL